MLPASGKKGCDTDSGVSTNGRLTFDVPRSTRGLSPQPRQSGGAVMAKKKKCPHFSRRKVGKWTRMVCTLPAGQPCSNVHCQAHPDYQEPDPDENE